MFPLEGQEWSVRMDFTNGPKWTTYSVFIIGEAKEIMIRTQFYKS